MFPYVNPLRFLLLSFVNIVGRPCISEILACGSASMLCERLLFYKKIVFGTQGLARNTDLVSCLKVYGIN